MKRIIAYALICAMLVCLGACANVQNSGRKAIETYMALIASGDYAGAYELISASSRKQEGSERTDRIAKQEFIDKYTNIFSALGITAVTYSNVAIGDGEIMVTATFDATYASASVGDMVNTFTLTAVREGGQWCVEWSPALIFPEMQWGDTVRVAKLSAKRGEILAGGQLIAATVGAVTVYAVPSKIENAALFSAQAGKLLVMSDAEVQKKLDAAYDDLAVLKQFYSDELSPSTAEQLLTIPGIGVDYGNYGTQREYPFGSMLAHIVGYVGHIDEAEIEALNATRSESDGLYDGDSIVGKVGIEKKYETELRGKDGELIYIRTAEGTNRRTLYRREAENGYDIELMIDVDLQQRLEEVIGLVLFGETTAAAVVVMNPVTGAIEAMASYPSYDLNLFTRGISKEDYQALLSNAANPLYNRLTQGLYPPGSTMKVFTAAAALDLGVLDASYVFPGEIVDDYWTPTQYGDWIWPSIKRATVNYRATPLNLRNAILHSDNIYFANAALMLGEDRFLAYMEALGFSESVPFDIGIAQPQLINKDTLMTNKLLADSGYGQGEILVTPLQLAAMVCAFANDGDIPVPRIIEGMYAVDGIKYQTVSKSEAKTFRQGVITPSAIQTLIPLLENVTDPKQNGTGRNLKARGCTVAAKTGTAEIGNDKSREISWFVGFRTGVSAEDARLVLVMLEVPSISKYAALKFDIARELLSMS